MDFDVVIVGAGAAGLMCAIEAGKRDRRVLVIERNDRPGRKILISGGGRCNFTNVHAGPENYLSANPHFCRSALARYTPRDFIEMVERHGIAYHEKKLGQLFCDGSATAIVDMLLQDCSAAGVEVRARSDVTDIHATGSGFELESSIGTIACEGLVIATGGLSIPKIGATDFAYRVAAQFGLRLVPTRPGLVPLAFGGAEKAFCAGLSGVSVDSIVSAGGADHSFRENLLFTHEGLSGPAVLQSSSFWAPGEDLSVDLLPEEPAVEYLAAWSSSARELVSLIGDRLPRRFAQAWCDAYAPSQAMNRYSARQLAEIGQRLNGWKLRPSSTLGYAKAEVTAGGIDTTELSSKTMEATRVPGLFFIGEAVDVTGWLGGYNFQWAWASGFAAGQYV